MAHEKVSNKSFDCPVLPQIDRDPNPKLGTRMGDVPDGVLERSQMEAAVDIEDHAGAEGEAAFGDGGDGGGDVIGGAPSADGGETVGDQAVVFVANRAGHVGGDDAGADFEDSDVLGGEAGGEEAGEHGDAGLGNAVIASVDGGGVGADGRDEKDFRARVVGQVGEVGGRVGDHPASHLLGDEEGSVQVGVEQLFETFLSRVEEVGADRGCDAGVVHQEMAMAQKGLGFGQQLLALGGMGDIGLDNVGANRVTLGNSGGLAILGGLVGGRSLVGIIDDQIMAEPGQAEGDGAADTPGCAGDQGGGIHGGMISQSVGQGDPWVSSSGSAVVLLPNLSRLELAAYRSVVYLIPR